LGCRLTAKRQKIRLCQPRKNISELTPGKRIELDQTTVSDPISKHSAAKGFRETTALLLTTRQICSANPATGASITLRSHFTKVVGIFSRRLLGK